MQTEEQQHFLFYIFGIVKRGLMAGPGAALPPPGAP